MRPDAAWGSIGDKRNHLTLVQREYMLNTARFRADQRDACAGSYAEVDDMAVIQAWAVKNGDAELAVATDFDFEHTWLDKELLMSQGVDGWRAEQLLQAMIGERERQERIEQAMRGRAPQSVESKGATNAP